MKKILCLIDSLGAGGAQRQMVGLASFLKEKGYDVVVAFYYNDLFYSDVLSQNTVPFTYIEKALKKTFRFWFIAKYIRKINPHVVIAFLETPSICACVARLFNPRFKLIVSERNTNIYTRLRDRFRFTLFRLADQIVPNAFSQEKYIMRTFPRLSSKIFTIPNFVDLSFFIPPKERHLHVVPEIMIVASIWPPKNTLAFIEVVAIIKSKGYRVHFSWYGLNKNHYDYITQCHQKIKQLQVADYIELKEKTRQIRDCYQNADLFCLPSFHEGTPNVICEAMACGLPIICSDVCDNSIFVKDEENGFLFNPNDISSMALSIEKMLSVSNEQYNYFCQHSRRKAEKLFSQETFISKYISVIES